MKIIRRYLSGLLLAIVLITVPVNVPIVNYEYVQAATVKLNKTNVTLQIGDKYTLKLSGNSKAIKWSSDNADIAFVTSKGKIVGVDKGKAKITAKVGTKKYICTVIVKDAKLTAEEVYNKCSKSTVQVNTDIAIGSGFYIDSNKVVTNYHVIDGASSISVQLQNGKEAKVDSILGYDKDLDIAILSVSVKNSPLKTNQHGIKIGESVYAIGSSLGFTDTFTNGIITNAKRIIENVNYIQTNAAITNGNSGGPLLNAYGEIMGINTMYAEGGQNLNFAINVSQINKVNTSNPMTVSEFANTAASTGDSSSVGDTTGFEMNEDTTKSSNKFTSQLIQPNYYVYGSISPNSLDYYNFELTKKSKVYLFGSPASEYLADMNYLYFAIYNSHDELVSVTKVDDTTEGQILDLIEELDIGTYYVAVLSDSDNVSHDITYIFTISY